MRIIKKQSIRCILLFMCFFYTVKEWVLVATPSMNQDSAWPEWKKIMRQEFLHNLGRIQNIVIQGESPDQVQDFLHYFNNQIIWFDKTLASAIQSTDPTLNRLKQHNEVLRNIVRIQQEAEVMIQVELKNMMIQSPDYAVIRLMLLYEINSAMQEPGNSDNFSSIIKTLSDKQKKQIVEKILRKISDHELQPLHSERKLDDESKKQLETKVDQLEAKLEKMKREKLEMQLDYEKKIALETTKNSKLEALILAHTQELATLEQQMDKSNQEILALKARLKDEQNQRITAELRQQLAQELADKRIQEYSRNSIEQRSRIKLEQELNGYSSVKK